MTRAFALRLLRRYPPAWRERYEAEVCALIEDSGVRVRDLAELIRGLITERVRELLTSAENPKRTATYLALTKPAAAVLFVSAAVGSGLVLRSFIGPLSEDARQSGSIVFSSCLIVFMAISMFTRRRPWGAVDQPYPAWVGAVLLPSLFGTVVLAVAVNVTGSTEYAAPGTRWISANTPWLNLFLYSNWVFDVCGSFWPGRKLLQAFLELQGAEQQLENSENWAASCREWIAKGVPSPLNDAERQVAEWSEKLAAARERVHAMGYRARFHRDDVTGVAA